MQSSSRRVLLLGAAGQLGRELQRRFADFGAVTAAGREGGDLANPEQLRALIAEVEPHVILNAAAYTAVDRAESEPGLAQAINAEAPRLLAEEAHRRNALLVHYSTDYVFDGSKHAPWVEEDLPHPLNVYGASKLAGEQGIAAVGGKHLIFRTSWVYAAEGKNFLLTMLRLGRERRELSVVDDQFGAPTSTVELAKATLRIVEGAWSGRFGVPQEWSGLYHMTCGGATSWFGFADAIFAQGAKLLGGPPPALNAIPSEAFPTPAHRPRNSVLSNGKLQARFGVRLAEWPAALDAVLKQLESGAEQTIPQQSAERNRPADPAGG